MDTISNEAAIALWANLNKFKCDDLPLNTLDNVRKFLESRYPTLEVQLVELNEGDAEKWIIVCCVRFSSGGEYGPIKPARMTFHHQGHFTFDVMKHIVAEGLWQSCEAPYSSITSKLDTLLANSGYLLCPGISNYPERYGSVIRFNSKNLRVWGHPHNRYDAQDCQLLHKPNNSHVTPDSPLYNACSACKYLCNGLNAIKQRAESAPPSIHEQWTAPSSNRPLKYLSPNSQAQRLAKNV